MCTPVLIARCQLTIDSGTGTGVLGARSHAQQCPLLFVGQLDIRRRLHEAAPKARAPQKCNEMLEYSLSSPVSTGKRLADQLVLECLYKITRSSPHSVRPFSSTNDHRRTLGADKDLMALVGNHRLSSRVTVWGGHGGTRLFAGEPRFALSQA